MRQIYKQDILVDSNAIDFDGKFKLPSVMKHFQNGASEHAAELGVDYFKLKEKSNAFWVITKIRLQVLRYPAWNEKLEMRTWPLPPGLIKVNRDFDFRDMMGEAVIRGISEWCVLDGDTRRPRKLTSTCYPVEFEHWNCHALDCQFRRFEEEVTTGDLVYEKTVRQSDLDLNYHMNNTVYTEMALDCFTAAELSEFDIDDFEIHFATECREGDVVQMYRKQTNDGYYIEGIRADSISTVFQVCLKTRNTSRA